MEIIGTSYALLTNIRAFYGCFRSLTYKSYLLYTALLCLQIRLSCDKSFTSLFQHLIELFEGICHFNHIVEGEEVRFFFCYLPK